jgi:phage/plasmid-associated DNA primase
MIPKLVVEEKTIFNDINTFAKSENDQIRNNISQNVSELKRFLNVPEIHKPKGDSSTNIFNLFGNERYAMPDHMISQFFILLEQIRREGIVQYYFEKQLTYSGIFLDFDLYHPIDYKESKIDETILQSITEAILKIINQYFDLQDYRNYSKYIITAIRKKIQPTIKEKNGEKYISDGFHIIIPGLQLTRSQKQFLIHKLILTDLIRKKILQIGEDIVLESASELPDINSAHVTVNIYGSSRKGKEPYVISQVFQSLILTDGTIGNTVRNNDLHNSNPRAILTNEFSLNYEVKDGYIVKRHINTLPKYLGEVANFEKQEVTEVIDEHIDDSHEIHIIHKLVGILNPIRSDNYTSWTQIMTILAKKGIMYKEIAREFSKKSTKYNEPDFEKFWTSLKRINSSITIGTLHFFAKIDNANAYDEIMKGDLRRIISTKIYSVSSDGHLEHSDIAEILYSQYSWKYKFSKCSREIHGSWYEFSIPSDVIKNKSLYKWHKINRPENLHIAMVTHLYKLFELVCIQLATDLKTLKVSDYNSNEEYESIVKYRKNILNNFKSTTRKLKQSNFHKGVIEICEIIFTDNNFADSLDVDENILGVSNGVLKTNLNGDIEFYETIHDFAISKSVDAFYRPIDFKNPKIKDIITVFRSAYPDDQSSTYEFVMFYMCQAMWGFQKAQAMLFLWGHGKEGKSALVKLFLETLGDYGVKLVLSLLTGRRSQAESANPAKMQLLQKRGATFEEASRNETLNEGLLKEYTGGEKNTSRGLHQNMTEFYVKSIFLAPVNYMLKINSADYATWRRILIVKMHIRFLDPSDPIYQVDNPFHRKALKIVDSFTNSEEYRSAFLSVLLYFWQRLCREYNGDVMRVPRPFINKSTAEYRSTQDPIENFINRRLVRTKETHIERIHDILKKYTTFMNDMNPGKFHTGCKPDDILNSKINSLFLNDRTGHYMQGYRFLNSTESEQFDEKFVFNCELEVEKKINDESEDEKVEKNIQENILKEVDKGFQSETQRIYLQALKDAESVKPETPLEYYSRIQREYELYKYREEKLKQPEESEELQFFYEDLEARKKNQHDLNTFLYKVAEERKKELHRKYIEASVSDDHTITYINKNIVDMFEPIPWNENMGEQNNETIFINPENYQHDDNMF